VVEEIKKKEKEKKRMASNKRPIIFILFLKIRTTTAISPPLED